MGQVSRPLRTIDKRFTILTTFISILMILFGMAEVVTSFTHQFFGLSTSHTDLATILGAILGLFYFAGGILLLRRKAWAAITALVLLGGDIVGRIAMVALGYYPVDSFRQAFGIAAGTLIAVLFGLYIYLNLGKFRKS